MDRFINEHKEAWRLETPASGGDASINSTATRIECRSPNTTDVLKSLAKGTDLQHVVLSFPHRAIHRYTWGEAPELQVLQSIDAQAYFSHLTAMHLHQLISPAPKVVYLNSEQSMSAGGGSLSQESIDRAFKGKCRISNNVCKYRGHQVCRLNGGDTRQLGVIKFPFRAEGYEVNVTDVERTLIDATVRPVYAGGVAAQSLGTDSTSVTFSGRRFSLHCGSGSSGSGKGMAEESWTPAALGHRRPP